MNFILKFLQKKSIRIAELEKAAASHNHIVGGHKSAYKKLKNEMVEVEARADALYGENQILKAGKLLSPDIENCTGAPTKPIDVEETMEQPVITT